MAWELRSARLSAWISQLMFQADGFTHHIAPATSWATQGPLGFALHTISPNGAVQTEFVPLQLVDTPNVVREPYSTWAAW